MPRLEAVPWDADAHYETVLGWWRARDWDDMPRACLPDTGAVAVDADGLPVAAGFVYFCEPAKMAFVAWLVTDPTVASPGTRKRGLDAVLDALKRTARERMGPEGFLFAVTGTEGMDALYVRHGFRVGERDATTLFHPLGTALDHDFLTEG